MALDVSDEPSSFIVVLKLNAVWPSAPINIPFDSIAILFLILTINDDIS